MMRKCAPAQGVQKRFSPEAYGDFPVVEASRIVELRERIQKETASDEWETIEDVIER